MKPYALLLGLLLAGDPIWAQSTKLAGVDLANFSKVGVKDSQAGQELAFQEKGAFINVPIVAKKSKLIFLNGLRYGQLNVISYNSPLYNQPEVKQTYYTLVYSLNIVKQVSPKWTMVVGVLPTLSSDFTQPVSHNDFLLQGMATARYQVHRGLTLGGGLVYSNRLGKPLLLPTLQLNYQERSFSLNVVLPFTVAAHFHTPNKRFQAGLQARTVGSFINIQDKYIAANNIGTVDKLSYTRLNIGPLVEWKVAGPLALELAGGITARRQFDFRTTEQNVQNADAKMGPFLRVSLSFSPKINGKITEETD